MEPAPGTHPSDAPTLLAQAIPVAIVLYQFRHRVHTPPGEWTSPPYAREADMLQAAVEYAYARHSSKKTEFDGKLIKYRLRHGVTYSQAEIRGAGSSYDQHATYTAVVTVSPASPLQCTWLDARGYPAPLKERMIRVVPAIGGSHE